MPLPSPSGSGRASQQPPLMAPPARKCLCPETSISCRLEGFSPILIGTTRHVPCSFSPLALG
jgi:hypothetical protein